jgi:hypothetical protein
LETGVQYQDAQRHVAQRLAMIELIPYASTTMPSGTLLRLPSAKTARNYVFEELLPRAKRGDLALIVTRQAATWALGSAGEREGMVVYDRYQARGASLSPASPGGNAILRRLRAKRGPQ